MYKIKQIPEDFIVKEITKLGLDKNGRYSYFNLTKENLTTVQAVEIIAERLNKRTKDIGFAGNKDKRAITEQAISISSLNQNRINKLIGLKNIKIEFIGRGKEPIFLGELKGNAFEITVRNLNKNAKIKKLSRFPNYFGEQRFSKNNAWIGRKIVKRDFKKAIDLILKNEGHHEHILKEYLKKNKNDYIGALRRINKKILMLYIHAYQSYLFNSTVDLYLKNKIFKNVKVPIVGFGFEIDKIKDVKLKNIIKRMLIKERVGPRDFVIRGIPEISSEGSDRNLFSGIKDLKIGELEKDELNKGKYRIKIKFKLSKGSYATVAIKELAGI